MYTCTCTYIYIYIYIFIYICNIYKCNIYLVRPPIHQADLTAVALAVAAAEAYFVVLQAAACIHVSTSGPSCKFPRPPVVCAVA